MTLEELMKSNSVSDDQIKAILAGMKENKIFTAGEENLDIRYGKLKTDYDTLVTKDAESTKLIEQLKAGTKDSEKLQGQITAYETQVEQLQEQLKQAQLDSEIKVALLGAKATDIDYMTFKLKEKGELELGEDGHIKGIDDKIAGLKTQFPTQFEKAGKDSQIQPNPLPNPNDHKEEPKSLADALRMQYENPTN